MNLSTSGNCQPISTITLRMLPIMVNSSLFNNKTWQISTNLTSNLRIKTLTLEVVLNNNSNQLKSMSGECLKNRLTTTFMLWLINQWTRDPSTSICPPISYRMYPANRTRVKLLETLTISSQTIMSFLSKIKLNNMIKTNCNNSHKAIMKTTIFQALMAGNSLNRMTRISITTRTFSKSNNNLIHSHSSRIISTSITIKNNSPQAIN